MSNLNATNTGYLGLIDWRRSIPGVGESYIARNGKGTPGIAYDTCTGSGAILRETRL